MSRWSGVVRLVILIAIGVGLHFLGALVPGVNYRPPLSPRGSISERCGMSRVPRRLFQ